MNTRIRPPCAFEGPASDFFCQVGLLTRRERTGFLISALSCSLTKGNSSGAMAFEIDMSHELDSKLSEIESKIRKEESVLSGFKTMMLAHSKRGLRSQCEDGIVKSEKILSFFRNEREKIKQIQADSLPTINELSTSFGNLNSLQTDNVKTLPNKPSALDFRKHDPPLSREMIGFRYNEILHKLEIEEKVLEAVKKYNDTTNSSKEQPSKVSLDHVRNNVLESTEKNRIYSLALRELKPLLLAATPSGSHQENLTLKPGIRQPLSGRLTIKILAEQNISRSTDSELSIVLQIDGVARGSPFRLFDLDKRADHFVVDVERANEMELLVYSHHRELSSLVSLLWIPLAEIADDIRRRNALNPGWAPADSHGIIHSANETGPNGLSNGLPNGLGNELIEDWFKLEPTGKLLLRINFTRFTGQARVMSRLGRQGAVRKPRKPIVSSHLGHQFEYRQVYRPLVCSVCRKFAFNANEFQCQDCRFFCHASCASKIRAKCITRSDQGDKRRSLTQFYNIPHRFEGSLGLGASWCCHCGQMLSVLGGTGKKCLDCNLTCHFNCSNLVPNFCGMSDEMASQLIGYSHEYAQHKPPRHSLPANMMISNPTSTSIPALKVTSPEAITLPIEDLSPEFSSQPEEKGNRIQTSKKPASPSLSDYKLLSVLGRGNFGKVLLAQHIQNKNTVAIKILKKDVALENDEIDALSNEKKVFVLTSRSKHPFLIGLYACFQTPASILFVMDYVSGGDLMSLIQRQRCFSPSQVKFYTIEVVLALEFLHSKNIVYRDLKLDNVLLDQSGHIKVADYGLCKVNMPFGATTCTFCGTPEFMAPEILEDQKYGRAVDWWALGVLIYQMVLGQSPFKGADDTEIFEAILEDELLFPPTLPRTTVSILQKLLTRDPVFRLGGSSRDASEVKEHQYFYGVDWKAHLECRVTPPYIPRKRDPTDVSNFDKEFTSLPPTITPANSVLSSAQQKLFKDFDFVAD